jgi:ornithine carrier protein
MFSTPIELIKCRMQVQMLAREEVAVATLGSAAASSSSSSIPPALPKTLPPLQGPVALALGTLRAHGFRGLWLGQTGTLLRETGGSAAWFTTYEVAAKFFIARRQKALDSIPSLERRTLTKGDLAMYELMMSGAMAGVMYNVTLFPADSVKSAVQTWAELNPDKPRLGFLAMGQRIWRTRGLKGLYAGCGLTVMRSAPSSAMIFLIYETLMQKYSGWLG